MFISGFVEIVRAAVKHLAYCIHQRSMFWQICYCSHAPMQLYSAEELRISSEDRVTNQLLLQPINHPTIQSFFSCRCSQMTKQMLLSGTVCYIKGIWKSILHLNSNYIKILSLMYSATYTYRWMRNKGKTCGSDLSPLSYDEIFLTSNV